MAYRIIPANPNAQSARRRATSVDREVVDYLPGAVGQYGPCPHVNPAANLGTGGTSMAATLGPDIGDGQRRGSPTNGTSLQPLMGLLRQYSPAKGWVAGHLLNAELGGSGVTDNNLTPLTRAANHAHSVFENHIKRMLVCCHRIDEANTDAIFWYGVRYKVTVHNDSYALVQTPTDMHSYAKSHIILKYKFVRLAKFPPNAPAYQALAPPNTYTDVPANDPFLVDLQGVVAPNFAASVNINNWTPFVGGIKFSVEIHNQP